MLSHAGIPRLNGAISALEQGKPAFVAFTPADARTRRRLEALHASLSGS